SVDDELAAPPADEVDDGRAVSLLPYLADARDRQPRRGESVRATCRRAKLEAQVDEPPAQVDGGVFVGIADREERGAPDRERPPRRALRLRDGGREVGRARHYLPGRGALRAEHGVGPGEACEREDGCLDGDVPARLGNAELEVRETRPGGQPAGGIDEVHPDRLARERHRARSARRTFEAL